jgi:phosphatidate cytidylyltransferase
MKNYVASINGSLYMVVTLNGIIFSHLMGVFWGVFTMFSMTCNDTWAYFMGKAFGRTRLISLSPNKTLEGFLGGAFWTVVFLIICLTQILDYPMLICKVQSITIVPFKEIDCPDYENKAYTTYDNYNIFGLFSF